jgi:hypothetical protein
MEYVGVAVADCLFGTVAKATITDFGGAYTHTVEWTVNGHKTTQGGIGASASLGMSPAWGDGISGGQKAGATCKVTAYRGATALGSATVTFGVWMHAASEVTSVQAASFGAAVTVAVTRALPSFTHVVTWRVGSHSASSTGVATSASYTVPASWADAVPSATSASGAVTVDTYNGATKIGSVSAPFTLTVPGAYVPTAGALGVARVDGRVPPGWGVYVQGQSRATLSLPSAAGSNGSSVTSKTYFAYMVGATVAQGSGGASYTLTTGLLPAGDIYLSAQAGDSRGRYSDLAAERMVTVLPWSPVSLKSVSVQRWTTGDASGAASDTGTYLRLLVTDSASPVGGKNTFSRAWHWRRVGTEDWTVGPYTPGTPLWLSGASVEYSYEVAFTLADAFGSAFTSVLVPTAHVAMDFRAGGKGIAVGKVSESDGLEVDWPTAFNKRVDVPALTLDGTDLALPVSVANGGTDARNAADARANLGFPRTGAAKQKLLYLPAGSNAPGIAWAGDDDTGSRFAVYRNGSLSSAPIPLGVPDGGTGGSDAASARAGIGAQADVRNVGALELSQSVGSNVNSYIDFHSLPGYDYTSRIINDSGSANLHITAGTPSAVNGTINLNCAYLHSQSVYSNTVASAGNVTVGSTGRLYRSTSSRRYKRNVEAAEADLGAADGLGMCTWEPAESDGEFPEGRYAGLIAEDVFDALGGLYVTLDAEGRPDAIEWAAVTAYLVEQVKDLRARVAALELEQGGAQA